MATDVNIQIGYKDSAWFTANPTLILLSGQHIHLSDGADSFIDAYVIGDGTTELQDLEWKGLKSTITTESYTISGTTLVISSVDGAFGYFLQGQKCKIGGNIVSIIGLTVTFDDDYTGSNFEVIRLT